MNDAEGLDVAVPGTSVIFNVESDLANLEDLMQQVEHVITEKWAPQVQLQQHECKSWLATQLGKHHDDMTTLKKQLSTFEDQKQSNKAALLSQQQEVEKLHQQLQQMRQNTDKLLMEREQLQQQHMQDKRDIVTQTDSIAEQSKVTKKLCCELEKAAAMFRDNMALKITKISGERLQFVFTCLDPNDVSRPFCICLRVLPGKVYSVTNCDPPLPDIATLTERLQKTNNLQAFILTVRKHFKDCI